LKDCTTRCEDPVLTGRATTPRDEQVQDGTTLWRPPSVEAW
jgi:hypothetical protein